MDIEDSLMKELDFNLPETLRAWAKSAEETNPDLWPLTSLMLRAAAEIERLRNEE